MLKDFRDFAMKGNIVDMAIGVIIGGAFGKIVSSLVNDIIMPIFGIVLGKVDFSNLFISLDGGSYKTLAEAANAGAATLNYGIFINTIIEFLIISFSIFLVIKKLGELNKKEEIVEEATTKECPYCFSELNINATRCPHCTSQLDK